MKKKLVISFSGGLSSAYMTKVLLDALSPDEWEIAVIFANTGREREETFQFIQDCDKYFGFDTIWVEALINPEQGKGTRHTVVSYKTASRNGEPFEQLLLKYGIPNFCCKHCTRELKIKPIQSYAKNILGWKKFYTAIGIRNDEAGRMDSDFQKKQFIYPMVTIFPTIRLDVNRYWKNQPFTLNLKSYEGNCDYCFEKSERKLLTLCRETPERLGWWIEMERRFENYVSPGKNKEKLKLPLRFFRGNKSIHDLIEKSKQDFNPAYDESQIFN